MSKKVGRNEQCPCGSGRKYKFCHGAPVEDMVPQEVLLEHLRSHEIREFQRKRQQGLGSGIVSTQMPNGPRIVVVYNRVFTGSWKTFHDFLFHYVKVTLGEAWGNAAIAKPAAQRHPVIQWYQLCCEEQARHPGAVGELRFGPMTGAVAAYLGLAYDLYTLEHNGAQIADPCLQARLITRLKHPEQFIGARQEIRVAAFFLRAGFNLVWEDESSRHQRHCEFTATFPATGKAFGVECKIRQPAEGQQTQHLGRFVGLVSDALRKDTPYERIVLVDLNTPAQDRHGRHQDWREWAVRRLRLLERNPQEAALPSAYVVITSYPYHHHLHTLVPEAGAVFEGFKIPDYKNGRRVTLREALSARERHIEMEALRASMAEHTDIPMTFVGEIPQLQDSHPLIIGHKYEMDDGVIGELESACVDEAKGVVAFGLHTEDGRRLLYSGPMSELEIAAWRRYPETFFGEMGQSNKPCNSPLELYDALFPPHLQMSRTTLLSCVRDWPNQEHLASLPHHELARQFVEAMVNSVTARAQEEGRKTGVGKQGSECSFSRKQGSECSFSQPDPYFSLFFV